MASQYAMDYSHTWVASGMYVDQEDLGTVAQMRSDAGLSPIECEHCEDIHPAKRVCPNGSDVAWLDEVSA